MVSIAALIALAGLGAGMALCLVRLALGPSLPDRVVALDVAATLLVGAIILQAIIESEPVLLRVATVLALVNFLGTIAFATYIARKALL